MPINSYSVQAPYTRFAGQRWLLDTVMDEPATGLA